MENILERIKVLMKYDNKLTLTENIEILNKNLISEQLRDVSVSGAQVFLDILKNEKAIFSTLKQDIPLFRKFQTVENAIEELSKLSRGERSSITNADMFSTIKNLSKNSPEIASKLKGLIGKSEGFNDIAKKVFRDGTMMPANSEALTLAVKHFENFGLSAKETEELLKQSIQQGSSIKAAVKDVKNLKGGSTEVKQYLKNVKTPTDAVNNIGSNLKTVAEAGVDISKFQKIGRKIGKYGAQSFEKIKSLAPKMNLKNLLIFGLAGGVSAIIMKQLFGDDPNPDVLDPCVVNSDKIQLLPTSTGDIMGFIKNTGNDEYDSKGGLKFYSNGRVFLGDNSKKGNYSCSTGGKLTIANESINKKRLTEETVLDNIEISWDKSPAPVTPPKPTAVSIPNELDGDGDGKGDIEGVKYFQDWLDTNYAGWAEGYPDGKVSKGKGYGKFGPKTQRAWRNHNQSFKTFIGTRTKIKSADELQSQTKLTNPMDRYKSISDYNLTNTSKPTTQTTPNNTTVDGGTTLPPDVPGSLNDPNYQPNTQSGTQQTQTGVQQISNSGQRKRGILKNILGRNK